MLSARLSEPLDRSFMGHAAAWLVAAFCAWMVWLAKGSVVALADRQLLWPVLVYHVVFASAASFLLACLGLTRTVFGRCVAAYAAIGAAALVWGLFAPQSFVPAFKTLLQVWSLCTMVIAGVALLGVMLKLRADLGVHSALITVAAWWGCSLVLSDLAVHGLLFPAGVGALRFELTAPHIIFCAYVVALWLLLTGRVRWIAQPKSSHDPHERRGFSSLSLSGMDLSSQASQVAIDQQEFALAAVEQERRRIAQDIHDGVGSQLVGLLASLDANVPAHRRIMLGLESCLLDLKTTVDHVDRDDDSDTNIFDALGRLRYRFQPSLSRLGIRMQWKIDVSGPLIGVRSSQLVHIVRIVQECLANVLMHSEAKTVRVTCRYEEQPTPSMLLEILDNGVGMAERPPHEIRGKGLNGIKERAETMGAELKISTKLGLGTRVRLSLPLA